METGGYQIGRSRLPGLAALALAAVSLGVGRAEAPLFEPSLAAATPPPLLDADLVFRRGRDAIARIALAYSAQPRFSHVGLIVREGDATSVVHAIPVDVHSAGGVRREALGRFVAADMAADVAYYRIDALTSAQRAVVRRYVLDALGRPFDYQFQYSDSSAVYCTELVVKALAAAGLDLSPELTTVTGLTLREPVIPPDALGQARPLRPLTPLRRTTDNPMLAVPPP